MDDPLSLPTGPVADASLSVVRATEHPGVADHSVRSFLYARLLAAYEGSQTDAAYDEELLFAACILHDVGLGTLAAGQARFEVEGADLAASLLTEHGVAAADVDRVWEAIALHSSVGIAERRGLLSYLTHKGVFIDVGRLELDAAGVDEDWSARLEAVGSAYPRPLGDTSLIDAIVEHAGRSPGAAPPFSLSAELLRLRRAQTASD